MFPFSMMQMQDREEKFCLVLFLSSEEFYMLAVRLLRMQRYTVHSTIEGELNSFAWDLLLCHVVTTSG